VAETCPLCKGEISAFVSAAPGDHRLFTRPSETARAVQGGGAVDGLANAVAVQHALHELLAQRATSAAAAAADETGSTISTTSGISSASGGSTASAASVSVISSSGGSSCGSSGRSSSRGQSSESGSFSDSASSSPALPPGEPSAKRLRGAASASVVGFAPEQPTSRLAPMAARPKPVAEMLSDLGRAIVEAQTALKQLESAS
jgi:hypothetical protein